MKKQIIFFILFLLPVFMQAQDMTKFHLYNPEGNAEKEIADAVKQAHKENKNVFIQIGGNWCIWCARFNDFISNDVGIDSLVKENYVICHLNYSKENTNAQVLAKYRFPQRFGFPVFLILDKDGNFIHTQNSGYLEDGKSYSREKVMDFFQSWTPLALDPSTYKQQ
jgi:thioredoxin-related protein